MLGDVRDADIFVVGTAVDPHVGAVLDLLSDDLAICRLNVDKFPATDRVTVSTGNDAAEVVIDSPDGSWDVTRCKVAWFRRLGRPGVSAELSEAHQRFAGGEADETLSGMLSVIKPKRWLNEYWATRRASTKLLQYQYAQGVGLSTPHTLVTSDAARAKEFLGSRHEFVYKTLHSPVIDYPDQHARGFIFTSRIDLEDLERTNSVRFAPCQFQRRIEVAYEMRVTSVGDRHIGIRIDGAASSGRTRDWRADSDQLRHARSDLPAEIETALTKLMRRLELDFGASDWIVSPDGEHVFLEINPHGAWLWLEESIPDTAITRAVAGFLEAAC